MNVLKIKNKLSTSEFGKFIWRTGRSLYHFFFFSILPDKYVVKRDFKRCFGYYPNLKNPHNLNEKLMWMKLYDREKWHSLYADKYAVRHYLKEMFGEEYLIPLLYETKSVKNINPNNLNTFPCIVKSNHAMAQWKILRSNEVNWKSLRRECRDWLAQNWYNYSKEYQYKYIERKIIVEKLLETKEGKIPNDYKLHFINGKLAFIYVSYDREGVNDRCIYNENWEKLPFSWVPSSTYRKDMGKTNVPRPSSLDKMIEMGSVIAKKFPRYIRVDFYDVDGHPYFGEITFHHGGGFDTFYPEKYNEFYGQKLIL